MTIFLGMDVPAAGVLDSYASKFESTDELSAVELFSDMEFCFDDTVLEFPPRIDEDDDGSFVKSHYVHAWESKNVYFREFYAATGILEAICVQLKENDREAAYALLWETKIIDGLRENEFFVNRYDPSASWDENYLEHSITAEQFVKMVQDVLKGDLCVNDAFYMVNGSQ